MKNFITFFFLLTFFLGNSQLNANKISQKKVIICGVCRNTERAFTNTKKNIIELGKKFKDYAVVIYENNSRDKTPFLYQKWAEENSRVNFVSETLPLKKATSKKEIFENRIEGLGIARNKMLDLVRNKKYRTFDYVIIVDLDFNTSWPIAEIVNSILVPFEWDCITANGIRRQRYYDRYAFRDINFPFGPEILGQSFWTMLYTNQFKFYKSGEGYYIEQIKNSDIKSAVKPFYPVYSAFGGLAIYKRDTLIRFSYSGKVTVDLMKYYQNIFTKLSPDNSHLKEYLALNNLTYDNANGQSLIYEENTCDPLINSITCCEHIPLHASMAVNGYGKFFVNINLKMFYDK